MPALLQECLCNLKLEIALVEITDSNYYRASGLCCILLNCAANWANSSKESPKNNSEQGIRCMLHLQCIQ